MSNEKEKTPANVSDRVFDIKQLILLNHPDHEKEKNPCVLSKAGELIASSSQFCSPV